MDLARVVSPPGCMILHDLFNSPAVQVRSGECTRVKQHILYIMRQLVTVPDAKMIEFVSPKKQSFGTKRHQAMVDSCQPLWHTVVIRIFGFKRKLLVKV